MASLMLRVWLFAIICVTLAVAASRNDRPRVVNDRPIIGILAMEVEVSRLSDFGDYTSHIAASYVKYLEGSGARIVPIMINKKPSYYKEMVQKVNGIFIPGAVAAEETEDAILRRSLLPGKYGLGYGLAGIYLYKYAVEENLKGNYLPIWGTCMGFHLISFAAAGPSLGALNIREKCSSNNQIIPLEFTPEAENSRLFGNAPESILKILSEENVTAHFHIYCLTEEKMAKFGLSTRWRALSTNHDFNGMKFVSTIEAKDFPFYASIYHPEKNAFEWVQSEDSPHNSDAIKIMQYLGNFFVDEARKSSSRYPTVEDEEEALIYNYNVTYTGLSTTYEQVYFFK